MISVQFKKKNNNNNRLLDKRVDEIQKISIDIDFDNLTYHFKSSNSAPINFIKFRGPIHIFDDIKNRKRKKNKIILN